MSLHHHILAAAYYSLRTLKAVGRSIGLAPENQLRVFLYHDIAPVDQANFAAQLRWLQRSWNFVSVGQFESMVCGKEQIHSRNLLLTFDDGFTSNRVVAEEVLKPLGIQVTSSADTLEQRLGVSIDHFSYTFGNLASFSEKALAVARRRFRFIYSGLRGDNAQGVSPFALRRDSAEFQDEFSNYTVFSNRLLGAFLEGAADAHYAPSRARLDAWNLRE